MPLRDSSARADDGLPACSPLPRPCEGICSSGAVATESVDAGDDAAFAAAIAAAASWSAAAAWRLASRDWPGPLPLLIACCCDWARLGPLTRQELLNAAQQNGPPAYREMIKNYYVRIAKLDREGRSNGPQSKTPTEPRNGKKR